METETHRGYYTTEEYTTKKSKKVAWFTFGDNDFADKVELNLSNRELIQEDGKWFVVKKKKEYPKTYGYCCDTLECCSYNVGFDRCETSYDDTLHNALLALRKLIICRDAYWKLYGEEMGLGKPWEPGETKLVYPITRYGTQICIHEEEFGMQRTFEFPTEEMRDAFYENFKELIEQCKELL